VICWLAPGDPPERFPPVDKALAEPAGLLAAGGDLSCARLEAAYRRGIFPWYSAGQPVLWWSPDPREVFIPAEFHVARSLARSIRRRGFEYGFDTDFAGVIAGCAEPRPRSPGTWITPEMQAAYTALHACGLAHSAETWCRGRLVGGVYGVRLGRVFFGESMFSRETDASKAALAGLVTQCLREGIELIDCQLPNPHLRSLGSRALPRAEFLARLAAAGVHP
jgi:leucyl/phenylalanyl-tRNA---protein transferase